MNLAKDYTILEDYSFASYLVVHPFYKVTSLYWEYIIRRNGTVSNWT